MHTEIFNYIHEYCYKLHVAVCVVASVYLIESDTGEQTRVFDHAG